MVPSVIEVAFKMNIGHEWILVSNEESVFVCHDKIGDVFVTEYNGPALYPTAEAALASIKVYDLNGVEVPRPSMEDVILGELNLASRGRGAFLEMKDLQVKAKIEEAMRCNEAGLKSATSLHLGEALRLLKERAREGGDLAKSTLADHGITYNDERRNEGGC